MPSRVTDPAILSMPKVRVPINQRQYFLSRVIKNATRQRVSPRIPRGCVFINVRVGLVREHVLSN
jgi:hypothetical protein